MPKPPAGRLSLALAVFFAELTGAPVLGAGHGPEVKKRLHEQRKKAAPPVAGSADLPTSHDPAPTVAARASEDAAERVDQASAELGPLETPTP